MGMIPEIMLDIMKTAVFLRRTQNIVTENEHGRIIGAFYILKAKQGTDT